MAKKSARDVEEKIVEARRYATKDDTKKNIYNNLQLVKYADKNVYNM